MREKRGVGGTRTPSMVAVMRCSGTPVSCACISISVTPHDDTPARKASLLVKASGCGRVEESSTSPASRVLLRARPTTPLLVERTISIFSSAMVGIIRRAAGPGQTLAARSKMAPAQETRVKLDVAMLTHDLKQIPDYARKV